MRASWCTTAKFKGLVEVTEWTMAQSMNPWRDPGSFHGSWVLHGWHHGR